MKLLTNIVGVLGTLLLSVFFVISATLPIVLMFYLIQALVKYINS